MVMQKRKFHRRNHTYELIIKFYQKLENALTKECHQNKCMIKSIRNLVEFLSLHDKAKSYKTHNKYTTKKQMRNLLKMMTMKDKI